MTHPDHDAPRPAPGGSLGAVPAPPDPPAGVLAHPPPLAGALLTDDTARSRAAGDFGGLVSRAPDAVLRPGSVADVAAMVRHCHDHGVALAARGQGHSTFGQAQVGGGVVVDMSALHTVEVDSDGGYAHVQAGARWSEVLAAALPHGRTPPVLTDYLELSVGGTLSAGGVGGTTHRHGLQVDTVRELEVVAGTGERLTCSARQRPGLFHAVLGGLGQCAVIVRATLALTAAPAAVRRYQLPYPSVRALTVDQRHLVREGRFDHIQGQVLPAAPSGPARGPATTGSAPDGGGPWRFVLDAAVFHDGTHPPDDRALVGDLAHQREGVEVEDLSYPDFAHRLAPGVALLTETGEWHDPHPWWNMFLPDNATDDLASVILTELRPADLGPSGVVLLYPFRCAALSTLLPPVPAEPLVFLFALLRTATPTPGVPDAATMVAANRALYERVRAVGGCRYPVGSVPMAEGDWPRHFGAAWPALAIAKREYDPRGILAPGQRVFGAENGG